MKAGDRVEFVEDRDTRTRISLGRVTAVSRQGYVRVLWDDGNGGYFSPGAAAEALRGVTGDDALPRHRWITKRAGGDPAEAGSAERVTVCDECGIEQTDENEFEPCR